MWRLISVFTFVIPMAFINYYPTLYLFGRTAAMGVPARVVREVAEEELLENQ